MPVRSFTSTAYSAWISAGLAAAVLVVFPVVPVGAATVPGMYEATVPLSERSDRGQAQALQDAMRQVLVRITGRRDAATEPALAPLITEARRYVQQFRVVGTNQFSAGFDGARVERAVTDAGQPLWGHERPATLVLLTVGEGAARSVVSEEATSELKTSVTRAAQLRGVPLVWPSASRPVTSADLSGATASALAPLAARFGADAVLAGAAGAGGVIRWTLIQGTETNQWRGSAEEGPQGAADWFARVFSAQSSDEGSIVGITVSGVNDLRAYAAVSDYLQSLALVRNLAVDEVAGDNVVFRARVQGGSDKLARAINLGGRLEPLSDSNGNNGSSGALAYRFRP